MSREAKGIRRRDDRDLYSERLRLPHVNPLINFSMSRNEGTRRYVPHDVM